MKYIIRTILVCYTFALVFSACSNDGSKSSVFTRKPISYFRDLNVYVGSDAGAVHLPIIDTAVAEKDKDTWYRKVVLDSIFPMFKVIIDSDEASKDRISFEFLENGMLSYFDATNKTRIISDYIYNGDDLYILKNGTEEVYVATREDESAQRFYRYRSILKNYYILPNGIPAEGENPAKDKVVVDTMSVEWATIDAEMALNFAAEKTVGRPEESMKVETDSLFWCNIKHIYER